MVRTKVYIKKTRACRCVSQVNAELEARGVQLDSRIQIDFSTGKIGTSPPVLSVVRINPRARKSLPTVLCTFCPFCGRKVK